MTVNNYDKLIDLQCEYFETLKSCKLTEQISDINEQGLVFSKSILSDVSNLTVQTTKRWQPSPVSWVEEVFEKIGTFWENNNQTIKDILKQSPAHYIQVEPIKIESSLRKYGCFFNAILIPDQILLSSVEHQSNGSLVDWKSLVLTTINTIAVFLKYEQSFCPSGGQPLLIVFPSIKEFDEKYKAYSIQSTIDHTMNFLSELSDRKIDHPAEFIKCCRDNGVDSFNPKLLNAIYYRDGVENFNQYCKVNYQSSVSEQGVSKFQNGEPPEALLFLDIASRISEFDRCHSDSYLIGQEGEILSNDLPLFEWWFSESTKQLSPVLGSRYSESELFKIGLQSNRFAFLQHIPLEDLLIFLTTEPVLELRESFAINRLNLKRTDNQSFESSVDEIGLFMEEKIILFEESLAKIKILQNKTVRDNIKTFGVSIAVTIASIFLPPVSVISLIFGGTLHEIISERKKVQNELKKMLDKPIATLTEWNSTTKG